MDPKFGARSWSPPWGLTKADRAQNSKRELSNLLYESMLLLSLLLLLFDFKSINYEIFFIVCCQRISGYLLATLEGASAECETRKDAEVLDVSKNEEKELITHSAWYLSTMTTTKIIIIIIDILSFRFWRLTCVKRW